MTVTQQSKRDAIQYMRGYYLVQLWAVDDYPIHEEGKRVLREHNQEVIDKYDADLLVHDLKIEML